MTKLQKEFYDYLQKLKVYDNPKFVETALKEFFKYWEMYEKRGCKDSMTLAMKSTEAFVGFPVVAKPCEIYSQSKE